MDQVVRKAMEKRDEALREVERWETWIKAYEELIEPLEPLDVLMPRTASPKAPPADDLDIASSLRQPDLPAATTQPAVELSDILARQSIPGSFDPLFRDVDQTVKRVLTYQLIF
jgi:hypothetical protein